MIEANLKDFIESTSIDIASVHRRILETVYFEEKNDKRIVLLCFNGAADHVKYDPPFFQRWSWFENIPYTRFHIHDHSITKNNRLSTGWYLGHKTGSLFFPTLKTIQTACQAKYGDDVIFVAIGSSVGGFAAIRAALHGYVDYAFAVNPQTDIRKYRKQQVNSYIKKCFDGDVEHPTLANHASLVVQADKMPAYVKCTIYQNYYDKFHYENHFLPLVQAVNKIPQNWKNWDFHLYANEQQGHEPPPRPTFIAWVEKLLLQVTHERGFNL
jgi:hypothetical protein